MMNPNWVVSKRTAAWLLAAILPVALVMSLCACSSFGPVWGQAARAQQAAANALTPQAFRASGDRASTASARLLRVRVHVTREYAAEVADWRRQLGDLIDEANAVIGPSLDVRLELAEVSRWSSRVRPDDLQAVLMELAQADAAEDVDWVVGLVGSVPRFEPSFAHLGLGRTPGKHFVMRAMNDAAEYDAIMRELDTLDEAERRRLYRARQRHKTTSVFLHELGHTLAVIHERDAHSLMAPRYSAKAEGYSAAAIAVMLLSLQHRTAPAALPRLDLARRLVEHIERTSESWVPGERDELLARLRAELAAAAQRSHPALGAGPTVAAPLASEITALSPDDRVTFTRALRDRDAGRMQNAWNAVAPLFEKYPAVYAMQELRCQLAMQRGVTMAQLRVECDRMMKLTPGASEWWRK